MAPFREYLAPFREHLAPFREHLAPFSEHGIAVQTPGTGLTSAKAKGKHSRNGQGIFREQSGNIQRTFRES